MATEAPVQKIKRFRTQTISFELGEHPITRTAHFHLAAADANEAEKSIIAKTTPIQQEREMRGFWQNLINRLLSFTTAQQRARARERTADILQTLVFYNCYSRRDNHRALKVCSSILAKHERAQDLAGVVSKSLASALPSTAASNRKNALPVVTLLKNEINAIQRHVTSVQNAASESVQLVVVKLEESSGELVRSDERVRRAEDRANKAEDRAAQERALRLEQERELLELRAQFAAIQAGSSASASTAITIPASSPALLNAFSAGNKVPTASTPSASLSTEASPRQSCAIS